MFVTALVLPFVAGTGWFDNEEKANIALVEEATDQIWNQRDYGVLQTHYSHGFDRDGLLSFAVQTHEAYPEFELVIDDVSADGDKVITEWTVHATHGSLGKDVEVSGITVSTVEEGVIVATNGAWDQWVVFQTLGVDPFQPDTDANVTRAHELVEKVYNTGNFARLDLYVSDDATISVNGADPVPYTPATLMASMEKWEGVNLEILDTVAQDDQVSVRWQFTALHVSSGQEVSFPGTSQVRYADGRIVEVHQSNAAVDLPEEVELAAN